MNATDQAYLLNVLPRIADATALPLARMAGEYRDKVLPHASAAKPIAADLSLADHVVDLAGNTADPAAFRSALLASAQTLIQAALSLEHLP
jgi:hypothetical protein